VRLVVFGSGHPFRGGVARTTTELVRGLEARGHEIRFLTPRRQYPGWLFPGADDRDPEACPRLACAEAVLEPLNPLAWPAARRRALAIAADAWVVPYWTWAWAGWWRFLLRAPHPPAVAVVHNPADHDSGFRHRLAARTVLRRCAGLFTHARVLEEGLAAAYPGRPTASCPLPGTAVAPLPERSIARRELDLPDGPRVALFMGLIRPYKGVDLLLEALARLPAAQRLGAGGGGRALGRAGRPRRAEGARARDRTPGAPGRLGWVPEPEVPRLLAAADLVVLPYRSGSQSAVAPMALAAGVPVLSTAVGGLAEVVSSRRLDRRARLGRGPAAALESLEARCSSGWQEAPGPARAGRAGTPTPRRSKGSSRRSVGRISGTAGRRPR
jgi:glycosyltransferase involved in cell wall biosynthesis